jgi:hypothetical protein
MARIACLIRKDVPVQRHAWHLRGLQVPGEFLDNEHVHQIVFKQHETLR